MDSSKIKLTIILLMTALPILLATWVFSVLQSGGVTSTTNNGELIIPVLDITDLGIEDAEGNAMFLSFDDYVESLGDSAYVARPWAMIILGTESCVEFCEERVYYARQLHRLLAADAPRLTRYYINASTGPRVLDERTQAMFAEAFSGMVIGYSEPDVLLDNLRDVIPGAVDPVDSNYILLADPVGNVMMYFTPENTAEEILEDVETLLDQSSLG